MATHKVNHATLCKMAQWEPFYHTIGRQSLLWLGHVARMRKDRKPKQALFGWWAERHCMAHAPLQQGHWLDLLLREADINRMDWFRLAQDRKYWRYLVNEAFPQEKYDKELSTSMARWVPGTKLPITKSSNHAKNGIQQPSLARLKIPRAQSARKQVSQGIS